jgi:predicted Zn-dependent peptidase
MDIEQAILSNGVTIVTIPLSHVQSISVVYYFRVGSRYESEAEAGMCHFIEHMLFKGTKRYPTARQISEAIEGVGGDFNGGTGKELTDYSVKISSQQADRAFDVLTDLVCDPLFAPAEMEKERRVISEELNMYKDTPQEWVQVLIDELLFPGQPLGREVVGTRESIASITHEQMRSFFATHYTPNNLVVCVAGDITHAATVDALSRRLGDWQGPSGPSWSPCTTPANGPHVKILRRDTEQVSLCMAFPALGHTDPDHDASVLLNALLGDGMSSRLFQSIREEQGLAYDIGSAISSFYETGMVEITAGCDPDHVDAVVAGVLAELRQICDEPPVPEELQRIKDYTRGRFVIGLEDTYSVATWAGNQRALRGTIRSVEEILAQIKQVTPADLRRVAQRIFREESLCLAAIGPLPPAEHFTPLLKL